MMGRLIELLLVFAPLSLVAIGGGNTVLPDIHRQVVLIHGWMTETQFASAFVLAQAVPGPNILVVSLIGWNVAGLPGALVALGGICGPSSVLALLVARALRTARMARLRYRVQRGFSPLTIGLMLSGGVVLARSADRSPLAIALTLLTVLVLLRTTVHPLLLMVAGAVLGLAGLV